MKNINLKSITADELIDEIIISNLNPNIFLEEAVAIKRLDIIKALFDNGASTDALYDPKEEANFLNKYPEEISRYLSQYNQQSNTNVLWTCLDEVAISLYDCAYARCTNRNFTFNQIEKTCQWSIGLIARECDDEKFIEQINQMCLLESWYDRHQYISINQNYGQTLVSTLKRDQPESEIDPQYISPNIKGHFNIYLINNYELKSMLGQLVFNGEEFVGIAEVDSTSLFRLDGSIDHRIYDQMKEIVSKNHQNREGR